MLAGCLPVRLFGGLVVGWLGGFAELGERTEDGETRRDGSGNYGGGMGHIYYTGLHSVANCVCDCGGVVVTVVVVVVVVVAEMVAEQVVAVRPEMERRERGRSKSGV